MATYLYKCTKYGHITEHKFPMGENPEQVNCNHSPEEGDEFLVGNKFVCGHLANRHFGQMPRVIYNGTGFASTEIPRQSGLEGYTE